MSRYYEVKPTIENYNKLSESINKVLSNKLHDTSIIYIGRYNFRGDEVYSYKVKYIDGYIYRIDIGENKEIGCKISLDIKRIKDNERYFSVSESIELVTNIVTGKIIKDNREMGIEVQFIGYMAEEELSDKRTKVVLKIIY